MTAFIALLSTMVLIGPGSAGKSQAQFSSADHEIMNDPNTIWGNWIPYEAGWFILVDGTQKEEKGGRIYRWTDHSPPELLIYSTPREGFQTFAVWAAPPEGREIVVKGWRSPWSFIFYPNDPDQGFQRYKLARYCDDLTFWGEQSYICGTKFPEHRLAGLTEKQPTLITSINRALPRDVGHDVEGKANANLMVFAKGTSSLALAYSLHPQVFLFDLSTPPQRLKNQRRAYPIRFSGYDPPPRKYIGKPINQKRHLAWWSRFHRLVDLHWFQGDLYGKFRKGLEGYIWVLIDERGGEVKWDNNGAKLHLLAMSETELVWGKYKENDRGDIEWNLWRTSSFGSYSKATTNQE